ncbi:MAG: hypothetical protein JSS82_16230 [Bacteroidetes bacterium]|nr:hypothetical protein [Bacteroidota bacterium]
MHVKNQKFKDEETLLEMLFDFGIGEPSPLINSMVVEIEKELEGNAAYKQYYSELTDADDRAELYTEERDLRLAEQLIEKFDSFEVFAAKLFAIKGGERTLLYTLNLH